MDYDFFFSSRRRHTRFDCDWSSDVCSSDLSSVTGVFGGTVTFWEPPAYWTTRFDPLVLLTLPFDILDCDAVPLVIREAETLPFVIRLGPALAAGGIMRLPSPIPRSSSGKT